MERSPPADPLCVISETSAETPGAAAHQSDAGAPPARRSRFRPRAPSPATSIWLLTTAMVAATMLLFVSFFRTQDAWAFNVKEWLPLVAGFAAAEVLVVHMHFRRNAHSFSLLEVPMVLGLFFTNPAMVVSAQALGAGVALALHRRQPLIKLGFNVALLSLVSTLAALVFRWTGTRLVDHQLANAFGSFAATGIASATGVILVFGAISLSERRVNLAALGTPMLFGLTTTLFTTSLGVAAAMLADINKAALALLIVPAAGVYLATRAYTQERQRHQSLEFLYESAKALNRARKIEPALLDTLGRARDALRTDLAEVYLVAPDTREVLRSSIGPGDASFAFESVPFEPLEALWTGLPENPVIVDLDDADAQPELKDYLIGCRVEDAIVAPLRGDDRLLGFIVLADRRSDVGRYTQDDVRLVETLANQLAVALDNSELGRSLEQLQVLKDELARQAYHDPLTGLANRKLFSERVAQAFSRAPGTAPLAVLYIDLDDFKTINDSMGHTAGDELLKAVGRRLLTCVRGADTVARLGGDEFAILLEELATASEPETVGNRILTALSEPVLLMGREVTARASIGVSTSEHADDADRIQQNADVAMYAAKARGKNAVAMFEPSLLAAAVERYTISADLDTALRDGRLFAMFQPIVNLRTWRMVGAEALVRWKHPSRGVLLPSAFITIAEDSSQITRVRKVMLQQSLDLLNDKRTAGLFIALNLAGRDIEDPDFVGDTSKAAAKAAIGFDRLMFEVSEAAVFREDGRGNGHLASLQEAGATVALDDFGTGYAALGQLRRLPVDTIKLAKVFVDEVDRDEDARAVAEAIITLGHILGKRIVAEGIERPQQLSVLVDLGCDMGQGYLLGRPMKARDLCEMAGQPIWTPIEDTAARSVA